jgi:Predicted aminoglycoside phosphotransferase
MKGKLIGKGYTAEVYEWNDKEVLKLFYPDLPDMIIEREYNTSKEIGDLGLPIPKVDKLIDFEGRRGIIYDKVTGVALLEKLLKEPFKLKNYIIHMTNLQYNIHQYKNLNLPRYKEGLEWNIRHAQYLSDEQKFALLNLLEKLPEGDCLCHGDYHPGNLIVNGEDTYILDWMTAAAGVPAADVARTLLLLKDVTLPDEIPGIIRFLIQIQRKKMAKIYLKEYMRLSGLTKDEINIWRPVIAGARMMERIPVAERKYLIKIVNQAN